MKISKKNYQHRRDFTADYVCEFCGYVKKDAWGYDDTNFHHNVIPAMVCPECGKASGVVTSEPDNPDWIVI